MGPESDCALSVLLLGAAIQAGWPWVLALRLFAGLRRGRPCVGGHGIIPERGKLVPPGSRWLSASLASETDPNVVATLFFDHDAVVSISCTRGLFGSPAQLRGPVPAWLTQRRSRWLPEFVRMELDAFGIPITPRHRVSSLVERRHVWDRLIKMDGVTRAVVMGKLSYPRTCWHIARALLPPQPQELGGGRGEAEAWHEAGCQRPTSSRGRSSSSSRASRCQAADAHQAQGGRAQEGT